MRYAGKVNTVIIQQQNAYEADTIFLLLIS